MTNAHIDGGEQRVACGGVSTPPQPPWQPNPHGQQPAQNFPQPQQPRLLTMHEREDILSRHLHHLAGQGHVVVQRQAASATIRGPKYYLSARTHWLLSPLHVLLALCTCGVWAVIALRLWGPWSIRRYRQVSVDEWGHVSTVMVRSIV